MLPRHQQRTICTLLRAPKPTKMKLKIHVYQGQLKLLNKSLILAETVFHFKGGKRLRTKTTMPLLLKLTTISLAVATNHETLFVKKQLPQGKTFPETNSVKTTHTLN